MVTTFRLDIILPISFFGSCRLMSKRWTAYVVGSYTVFDIRAVPVDNINLPKYSQFCRGLAFIILSMYHITLYVMPHCCINLLVFVIPFLEEVFNTIVSCTSTELSPL